MNREQLVEMLAVERFLPLPPAPKTGVPYDDPKMQAVRRYSLDMAVESFDVEERNRKRRASAAPKLVKKGLIYVAEERAA